MDIFWNFCENVVEAGIKIASSFLDTASQWITIASCHLKKTIGFGIKTLHKVKLYVNGFSLQDEEESMPLPSNCLITKDYTREYNGFKEFRTSFSCDLNIHHLKSVGKTLQITEKLLREMSECQTKLKPHLYRHVKADNDILQFLFPPPVLSSKSIVESCHCYISDSVRKFFHKIGPYITTFTFDCGKEKFCSSWWNALLTFVLESFPNLSHLNLTIQLGSTILDPCVIRPIKRFPSTTKIVLNLAETPFLKIFKLIDCLPPTHLTIVFREVTFQNIDRNYALKPKDVKSNQEILDMFKWFEKSNSQVMHALIYNCGKCGDLYLFHSWDQILAAWRVERITYRASFSNEFPLDFINDAGLWQNNIKCLEINLPNKAQLYFPKGDFRKLEHLKIHWNPDPDGLRLIVDNSKISLVRERYKEKEEKIMHVDKHVYCGNDDKWIGERSDQNKMKFVFARLSRVVVTFCFNSKEHQHYIEPFFPSIRKYVRELKVEVKG